MNKNTYKYVLLFLNRYKYVLHFLVSLVISGEIIDMNDRELKEMSDNNVKGSKNQATIVNLQKQIDETNSK